MGYFIGRDGQYFEGDPQPGGMEISTQRPTPDYDWAPDPNQAAPDPESEEPYIQDGQWVLNATRHRASTVPASVTMRQARIALNRAGYLAAVNAAIAALPTGGNGAGDEARITWEFASEIRRDGPLIEQLAPGLGLTDEIIDNLFIMAATL